MTIPIRHDDIEQTSDILPDPPPGLVIVAGKRLQNQARYAPAIPYGLVWKRTYHNGNSRQETVGVVIAKVDEPEMQRRISEINNREASNSRAKLARAALRKV